MDSFSTLWCLFGAIMIDLYAGSWFRAGQSLWHPKNILRCLVERLSKKLDRKERSSSKLLIRGVLSLLFTLSLSGLVGVFVHLTLTEIPFGWVLETIVLTSLVSVGRLWEVGTLLASTLESGSREDARRQLSAISPRDATYADSDEITRLGIETVIANFISSFIGPVLFYATLGLSGVFMYYGLTLSSLCGTSREYLIFSKRLITSVDWLLSLLGAVSLFCAILIFSETSARQVLLQGRKLLVLGGSVPYGLPKLLVAAAIGITLEGPRRYLSGQVERPYVGSGGAPSPTDLIRVVKLVLVAAGLTAGLILAVAVVV